VRFGVDKRVDAALGCPYHYEVSAYFRCDKAREV
jgi:hypothetical protein